MSIIISNLTKVYGNQKAIDNISFKVNNNEIVGFLGPNGAGKSTTMKIITGYLNADAGKVLVNGVEANMDSIAAKRAIGYLPEGNPLYYEMYVREYLSFIGGVHNIKSGLKSRIEEVIELTGLGIESHKKTGQLSKGYKQRVGFAAALIHDPSVLILDEPTSGLDPNQIVEIRQLIKDLGNNKTVLFSSHILQEVESICDRIIIIDKGKVVADDTLSQLQSTNSATHVVMVQFEQQVELNLLKNISGVIEVTLTDNQFHIHTLDAEGLKRSLLELSLQNNLDIVALRSKSKSLEEVFRDLTSIHKE